MRVFVCVCVCCLFVPPCLPVCLAVCLFVCLFCLFCLFVHTSVRLSVFYLSLSLCLLLCLCLLVRLPASCWQGGDRDILAEHAACPVKQGLLTQRSRFGVRFWMCLKQSPGSSPRREVDSTEMVPCLAELRVSRIPGHTDLKATSPTSGSSILWMPARPFKTSKRP